MDLEHVDKQAKDNNGVKYLLIRQSLIDRTADAKGKRTKASTETVRVLLTIITKKMERRKIGSTKEQNFLESLKNYAKLKAYKYVLH